MRHAICFLFVGFALAAPLEAAAQAPGLNRKVAVTKDTRLDWTFVIGSQSLTKPLDEWKMDGYDSTKQRYDLYVPPGIDKNKSFPLVLFISPNTEPGGFEQFAALCRDSKVFFASPCNAGNGPMLPRLRVVLDVLDDVRRRFKIDADRTYVSGHSGGARAALSLAFALPEVVGGALPIGAAGELRDEPWLQQRVIDRVSVALIAGETDFSRPEIERLRGPILRDVGVRTKIWIQPRMGHALPPASVIKEAFQWLEGGLEQRRALAKQYPAARLAVDGAPSREEAAKALFDEGKERLADAKTVYSGVMQMQGIRDRWSDLPLAAEARKLIAEYDGKKDKWESDDLAFQRRFRIAKAAAYHAYVTGSLPKEYEKHRPIMGRTALQLWQQILKDDAGTPAAKVAPERIAELKKLLGDTQPDPQPAQAAPKPVDPKQFSTQVLQKVNELRSNENQPPLNLNPILSGLAQTHASLMAKEKRLDVVPAKSILDQIKEAGYRLKTFGMDQQMVYELSGAAVYDRLIKGTIKGRKVRDELAEPAYGDIGIGVAPGAGGAYYIVIVYAAEHKQ